jgi:hypothetical protein
MSTQTFKEYVKSVRKVQWAVCAIPLGGRFLQSQSAFAFPPLGADKGITVFLTIAFVGLAAILPWTFPKKHLKTTMLFCVLSGVLSTVSYLVLSEKYIVVVPIPDRGNISISVGTVRTEFANRYFEGQTDVEMLESRGPYDIEVKKLWTEDSILWVRIRLFLSYLAAFMCLNIGIGVFARFHKSDPAKRSNPIP